MKNVFSTNHFIWLAICAVLITAGAIVAIKGRLSIKNALTVLCVICVLSEVVKIFTSLIKGFSVNDGGVYIKQSDLPFHLCSLQIFFTFAARLTKKDNVRAFCIKFMIPTCILGGFAALMLPTVEVSFTYPKAYQYFIFHSSIIWFAIFAIARSGIKLDFKAFGTTIVTLLVIVFFTIYINGVFQTTNFLYLSKPPLEGLPILNLDNGWFVYFISLMGCALGVVTLFYIPFWIYYAVKKRKSKAEVKSAEQ